LGFLDQVSCVDLTGVATVFWMNQCHERTHEHCSAARDLA
jgi:hypothetical protein